MPLCNLTADPRGGKPVRAGGPIVGISVLLVNMQKIGQMDWFGKTLSIFPVLWLLRMQTVGMIATSAIDLIFQGKSGRYIRQAPEGGELSNASELRHLSRRTRSGGPFWK